ncbi:MAG: aldehyde dehydrogenase family protein [Cyanobacteria bacterium P01_H01_bin.74]
MDTVLHNSLTTINPVTETPIQTYPIATPDAIKEAVCFSREAFKQWKTTSLEQRCQFLKQLAALLAQQADALAGIIATETGKSVAEALESDVAATLTLLRYYAKHGKRFLSPKTVIADSTTHLTGVRHQIAYQPRGVIGVISPWNYPLSIPASGVVTALLTGCAVVLKPSELTPETGRKLVNLIQAALAAEGYSDDLQQRLVQCCIGNGETGKALIESDIDGLVFTGSSSVGQKIQARLAERNIWYSVELGGNDAMLVLPDINHPEAMDEALSYAVWGRLLNAGQTCAAVKRLFLPRAQNPGQNSDKESEQNSGQESAWLARLKQKFEAVIQNQKDNPDYLGPLIHEKQLALVEAQVSDALSKGAVCLVGGYRLPRTGYYYAPTVLYNISAQSRVSTEEVFGPVLSVYFYDSVDDAVASINQTNLKPANQKQQAYGLTASVFSGNQSQAVHVASQLEAGTVTANGLGLINYAMPSVPWAGWKASGSGISHGEAALQEMSLKQVQSRNPLFVSQYSLSKKIHFGLKPAWHFTKNADSGAKNRAKAMVAIASGQWFNPWHWVVLLQNTFLIKRL